MSTPSLVVVGSVNRDVTTFVRHLPAPGETVSAEQTWSGLGGKGANQAVAAAAEGAEVWFVGAVGDDADGLACRADLTAAGVRTDHLVTVPGVPTGRALVTVDAHGENAIVVVPGANARVAPDAARARCAQVVATRPDVPVAALCQGELPAATTAAVAAWCRQGGHRFVLNPAPVGALPGETLAGADPLVVNEGEARSLLGGAAGETPQATAGLLRDRLGTDVVVTLGADGALWADAGGGAPSRVAAAPVEAVVNTTGAGDAFVGALAAALLLGAPVAVALERATLAGGRAVARRASSGR